MLIKLHHHLTEFITPERLCPDSSAHLGNKILVFGIHGASYAERCLKAHTLAVVEASTAGI